MTLEQIILTITYAAVIFLVMVLIQTLRGRNHKGVLLVTLPINYNYEPYDEKEKRKNEIGKEIADKFKENVLVTESKEVEDVTIERV